MKHFLLILLFLPFFAFSQIQLEQWKFKQGDDMTWAKPDFDDSKWANIKATTFYENQGYDGYNGYSWYRVKFKMPKSLIEQSLLKDSLRIIVARVDDIDATYLNGVKIGETGIFPGDPGGPAGHYDKLRRYVLPVNHAAIRWDEENTLAVRVFDGGGGGGLWGLTPNVDLVDVIDFVTMNTDASAFDFSEKGKIKKLLKIENNHKETLLGYLSLEIAGKTEKIDVSIAPLSTFSHTFTFSNIENSKVTYTFSEKNKGKKLMASQMTPYILTPAEKPTPKITNAAVFGARPSNPFLWTVTATGERPMVFTAQNLPEGLSIDTKTGVISGTTPSKIGHYNIIVSAENNLSKDIKSLKIVVGDKLALTPPMGWNSWNCWGTSVSSEKVKISANALIDKGLANHGWSYINIDDGWEDKRDANGELLSNEKFPDMKGLGDYLHSKGLKFGIYSSPGEKTCGGMAGSLNHEAQDAQTWANWGIDYIKYDWCSYNDYLKKPQNEWSIEEQILPFKKLNDGIEKTNRDMLMSVCNWGMNDVWKWADKTGGQLWRTSGDIEDSWASLSSIGFAQANLAQYNKIAGWNDPDMLIVGWVGWGDKLHQTKLTPVEQYTHISLWSILSAPLLIGCDISRLDAFTYNLLANDEIIAINQDILGKAATCIEKTAKHQIWLKEMADGSKIVGVFNLSDDKETIALNWKSLNLHKYSTARDPWRQVDVGKLKKIKATTIDSHGTMMYVLKK